MICTPTRTVSRGRQLRSDLLGGAPESGKSSARAAGGKGFGAFEERGLHLVEDHGRTVTRLDRKASKLHLVIHDQSQAACLLEHTLRR